MERLRCCQRWSEVRDQKNIARCCAKATYALIAARAVAVEARTHLVFSFEKRALRDAIKSPKGARSFAEGLYARLHDPGDEETKFDRWCEVVA
jgi:hypothetical protein